MIRKITLAALVAALVGGLLAMPASSKTGPVASASKCKKAKKGKHRKKKKCGGGSPSPAATLPGQATHATPTQPSSPSSQALAMSDIGLTDNPVLAGRSTSGQLTISGSAPSGGQSVTLQSSDPTRVTVPASVVVAAGQTTASFPVDTTTGGAVSATVSGSIGGSNVNTLLNVVSEPSVTSVALEQQCFTPGAFNSNQVTLDVDAPADTAVGLTSDTPLSLSVPATVTVLTGSKIGIFSATAIAPASPVIVTATLGSSDATDTASVNAVSNPAVSALSLSPDNVRVDGTSTGTVTLDCEAGPLGATVNLSSTGPADVTIPPSVTVPQGQLSATFPITTGTATGDEVISATGPSGPARQATLHVNSLGT